MTAPTLGAQAPTRRGRRFLGLAACAAVATLTLGGPMIGMSSAEASTLNATNSAGEALNLSRAGQVLYAYTDAGGTLDVSATFAAKAKFDPANNGSFNQDLLDHVEVSVTDPSGAETIYEAAYDGSADATISQSDIASSDGEGGVWKIEFYSVDDEGNRSQINMPDTYPKYAASESTNIPISDWEVTPRQGGDAQTGRVWAEQVDMQQDSQAQVGYEQLDVDLWYLSNTGVQYKGDFDGYNGVESFFTADSVGIAERADCEPTYSSQESADMGPDGDYVRATDDECAGSATTYRLFFEEPDSSMPETARWFDNRTENWVFNEYVEPEVSDPTYVPSDPNQTVYGGDIEIESNQSGTVTTRIDTNGDGDYDDAVDVTLDDVQIVPGTNSIVWDGLDGEGNPVPVTQEVYVETELAKVGEIHFTSTDVEERAGGIEVTQLVGPSVGDTTLYWNDSKLGDDCTRYDAVNGGVTTVECDGVRSGPNENLDGMSSEGGVHSWADDEGVYTDEDVTMGGTLGDDRAIDDWTFLNASATTSALLSFEPASLTVAKDDGLEQVAPGQETTYEIVVDNVGDIDERSATVRDLLPENTTFVSADQGGTYDEETGEVTWTGLQIAAGESTTVNVTVQVNDDVERPGEVVNRVSVQPFGEDPVDPGTCETGDNCDEDIDVTVPSDVRIVKTPLEVDFENNVITWNVEVANLGEGVAHDVKVDDVLADFADDDREMTASDPSAGQFDGSAWNVGDMEGGASETIVISTPLSDEYTKDDTIVNTARVTTPDEPGKGTSEDCQDNEDLATDTDGCDVAQVEVPDPALDVTKDDGLTEVEPGQELTYEIIGTNTGEADEPAAVLVDTLPESVTFVSASGEGVYDEETRTVTWPAAEVAVDGQITQSVTVTVNDDVERPSEFTNFVTITGEGDDPIDPSEGCDERCDDDTDNVVPEGETPVVPETPANPTTPADPGTPAPSDPQQETPQGGAVTGETVEGRNLALSIAGVALAAAAAVGGFFGIRRLRNRGTGTE